MESIVNRARVRRRHPEAFRQAVVAACCEPGASVAGVALAHDLNANLIRTWLRQRGITPPSRRLQKTVAEACRPGEAFVPVQLPALAPSGIHLELRRGEATVQVEWPLAAAGECGTWLRAWLG